MEASLIQALTLLLIGAVAGTLGGLLGIGGGLVMIPAMTILLGDRFGPNSFHLYKLAAIATAIVLSIPAALRHHRAGAIVPRMIPSMLILAILGAVFGVAGAAPLSDNYTFWLKRLFGGFLQCVVAWSLLQDWWRRSDAAGLRRTCPTPARLGLIGTVVGLPAGLIAGLLGIGGGVWAVPAQTLFLGVRLQNAIANSCCMIVGVAAATSVWQSAAIAVHMPDLRVIDGWWLALWLAPGATLGGWCGAGLTHRLPTTGLRYAFYALLVFVGIRLLGATPPAA